MQFIIYKAVDEVSFQRNIFHAVVAEKFSSVFYKSIRNGAGLVFENFIFHMMSDKHKIINK